MEPRMKGWSKGERDEARGMDQGKKGWSKRDGAREEGMDQGDGSREVEMGQGMNK